jgi:hypothetical protein
LDIINGSPEDRLALQGDLDNAVQRHLCQFYCQQKNKAGVYCRFDYPLPIAPRTCVAFKQTITGKGAKKQTKNSFELITARNDCWLNSLCVPIMEVWRAKVCDKTRVNFQGRNPTNDS